MSLMKRFYQDPYLHIRSFSLSLFSGVALCVATYSLRLHDYSAFSFSPWMLALVPFGIYIGGLSAVFMHNATHGSFKPKWMNWVAGNLAGIHQLWGFMGWKLIHLVHHHYSDVPDMDPHAPGDLSFWQFARVMFIKSSARISERYREHWGNTAQTRILQRAVLVVFGAMALTNLALCYLLLGPAGFVFFYIPSYISNHMLYVDINYTAHPKDENGQTAAANLNHTLYYKIANFFWFGIYFHGNHHRKPLLFNPRYMQARAPREKAEEELAA
ncbi:MAG: fatty acid desaturase [Alphaproteobacteria bacterium]|nr:fatty acid desaturase [Alphaproteobacteria bacterium]